MTVAVRRATATDGGAVAEVFIQARHHNVPAIPPLVHDDDDVRRHFAEVVMAECDVWVAMEANSQVVAILALLGDDVDHLYVAPGRTGCGIGAALIDVAKQERPGGLELWAFQSNVGACRFYERHGFVELFRTDGRDNMERAPDVRYAWSTASSVR
jgi:GNAT superfamily N-acetyltransferase